MDLYEVPLSMFCWVLGWDYVNHLMWYYVVVKSSFQHGREECKSKRAYVFIIIIIMFI